MCNLWRFSHPLAQYVRKSEHVALVSACLSACLFLCLSVSLQLSLFDHVSLFFTIIMLLCPSEYLRLCLLLWIRVAAVIQRIKAGRKIN